MKTPRSRRPLAAVTVALAALLLAGCSGDANPGTTADPGAGTSTADSPFASVLEGPETGEPGDTLTETLTNTGRLPDGYQISVDPVSAAKVDSGTITLGPGESVQVKITVKQVPFDVHVKSIGGGAPDRVVMTVS
ncbi:MAG: hypothetical protein JWO76_2364 [Nocardioides sp.]|nr:hypothetical protein [Nocardioides sp.]